MFWLWQPYDAYRIIPWTDPLLLIPATLFVAYVVWLAITVIRALRGAAA